MSAGLRMVEVYAAAIRQRLLQLAPVVDLCGYDSAGFDGRVEDAAIVFGSHVASPSRTLALHAVEEISIIWRDSQGRIDDAWWHTPLGLRAAQLGWCDAPNAAMTYAAAAKLLDMSLDNIKAYALRGDLRRLGRGIVRRREVIERYGAHSQGIQVRKRA